MTPTVRVQGLQSAVLASKFSGEVCFAPTLTSPMDFYHHSTLVQLAAGVKAVHVRAGKLLSSQAEKATAAVKEGEEVALHEAWDRCRAILEGDKYRSDGIAQDPIADFSEKLLSVDARQGCVMKGLKAIKATRHIEELVVRRLRKKPPTALTIKAIKDDRILVAFLDRGTEGTSLTIHLPSTVKILSAEQLNILAAKAAMATLLQGMLSLRRKAKLMSFPLENLSEGLPLHDLESVLGLRDSLADSRFKHHLGSDDDHDIPVQFSSSTLTTLAKTIAQTEPTLGAKLYVLGARAEAAERGHASGRNATTYAGWRHFAKMLKKPRARKEDPLVEMDVLARIVSALDFENEGRREWMESALFELGVPYPEHILSSNKNVFDYRWGIYPTFTRGKGKRFHVSLDTTTRRYAVVEIEVPEGHGKVSEDELKLLIARAFLLSAATDLIPPQDVARERSVLPGDLKRQIPMLLVKRGEAVQLGSVPLPEAQLKRLEDFQNWVRLWSAFLLDAYGADVEKPTVHVDNLELTAQMVLDMRRVERLMRVPNIGHIMLNYLSPLRAKECRFLFNIVPEDGRGTISVSSIGKLSEYLVTVGISSGTLARLQIDDIIDLFFKSTTEKEMGSDYKREVTFNDLRAGRGLTADMLFRRSVIKLAYAYNGLADTARAGASINGSGDIGAVGPQLAGALTAIARFAATTPWESHQAAWLNLLGHSNWYIHSAELGRDSVIDAIPVGHTVLIHAHDDAAMLTSRDWLYLMSVMAANPTRAVRMHIDNRAVTVGSRGDAAELYAGIAANRMFAGFGVFDPSVTLPTDASSGFPGGVSPRENPHFNDVPMEDRQKYVQALRWFTTATMPREWKPLASDTLDQVKKKRRSMNLAWHPDKRPGLDEVNLLTISNEYWDAVLEMYP